MAVLSLGIFSKQNDFRWRYCEQASQYVGKLVLAQFIIVALVAYGLHLLWIFMHMSATVRWFWGLVWARQGETRLQVGNSTSFIENVDFKVWPLERLDRAGRAARWETRGRYVTLLHCYTAVTLLLHLCYTGTLLHGPGLWTTAAADWNLGVESGGAGARTSVSLYNTLDVRAWIPGKWWNNTK